MDTRSAASAIVSILDELEDIRNQIEEIDTKVAKVKKCQDHILTTPVPEKKVKDELTELLNDIQKISANVKRQLLSVKIRVDEAEAGGGSSTSLRIQKTQHGVLWKKFTDVMSEFNNVRIEYNDKCKTRLQIQLQITGVEVSDEELNQMMEGDHNQTGVFSSVIKGNLQAQQALVDLQIRNDEIKNLESDIVQLRDLFLDVSTLVAEQGETVENIRSHIEEASVSVVHAKKDLKKAVVYKGKSRRKVIFCAVASATSILVVSTIVILLIVCVSLNKCS